ncbi:hypothetical protein H1R20_g13945, partial [Candolleomyces eurysporus]
MRRYYKGLQEIWLRGPVPRQYQDALMRTVMMLNNILSEAETEQANDPSSAIEVVIGLKGGIQLITRLISAWETTPRSQSERSLPLSPRRKPASEVAFPGGVPPVPKIPNTLFGTTVGTGSPRLLALPSESQLSPTHMHVEVSQELTGHLRMMDRVPRGHSSGSGHTLSVPVKASLAPGQFSNDQSHVAQQRTYSHQIPAAEGSESDESSSEESDQPGNTRLRAHSAQARRDLPIQSTASSDSDKSSSAPHGRITSSEGSHQAHTLRRSSPVTFAPPPSTTSTQSPPTAATGPT